MDKYDDLTASNSNRISELERAKREAEQLRVDGINYERDLIRVLKKIRVRQKAGDRYAYMESGKPRCSRLIKTELERRGYIVNDQYSVIVISWSKPTPS